MPKKYPQEVIDMLNNKQLGPAIETLMARTYEEGVIFAIIFVVASVVILAWPPRQKQPVFTTAANQGVSQ